MAAAIGNLTPAEMEIYTTALKVGIKEDSGGALESICKVVIGKGKKAYAYRLTEDDTLYGNGDLSNTTGTGLSIPLNLYANDGASGDVVTIEIDLELANGGRNVSREEMQTTQLDLTSSIMDSQVRKIGRFSDRKVTDAIRASVTAGDITAVTYDNTKTWADEEVINLLITWVAYTKSLALASKDFTGEVAVIMNLATSKMIYASNKFTSSDFAEMIHQGGLGNILKCKIMSYNSVSIMPLNEAYIVPQDAIAVGKSSDSDVAEMEWATGIQKYQIVATTHRGAAVVDPDAITVIKPGA